MLYVVIHHYSLQEDADGYDYLIGVFDTPKLHFKREKNTFQTFQKLKMVFTLFLLHQ